MTYTMRFGKLAATLAALMLFVLFANDAFARPSDPVNTSGRFRIAAGVVFGFAFDREYFADDTAGDPIHIGAGGGAGYLVSVGYGLSKRFDIDIDAVRQKSENKNNVINGGAEFDKRFILATLKYKMPYQSDLDLFDGQVKLGVGVGLYYSTNLTININDLNSGLTSSYIVDYKPALGYHLSAEFETFMPNDWTLTLGTRISYVNFEADDESYSGFFFNRVFDARTELEEMDGMGIDFTLTIGKYF